LVQLDSSAEMLFRDEDVPVEGGERSDSYRLVLENYEDEDPLPFPDDTFDLVISSASLHWVNQLPRLFQEVSRVLKPDGCFMFAVVGGNTLPELRASMVMADKERRFDRQDTVLKTAAPLCAGGSHEISAQQQVDKRTRMIRFG
jgi:NADH dehydrogenase [ubiquinone] 1 alpha subcomplex assembly factor 5